MGVLTGPLPLVPPKGTPGSQPAKGPSVVALGGGHGLSASLSALRLLTSELTAIVTVADDGGSSGRLREEYGVLPPGDLRMALSALCDDTDWGRTWRDVMQHRFKTPSGRQGSLDDHAMGNLLIVTLWELLGDAVAGLKWAGALLGARGQVLPMSTQPLNIEGDVRVPLPGAGTSSRSSKARPSAPLPDRSKTSGSFRKTHAPASKR
ncbi:putative gluconeogenesis factor [Arthrobacter sp. Hiyo8]|nr:putative gluconeogenesis factor [Arthrobacter sp. Hiyo8]